ncbi:unnamed protein product [Candidula unifasciata]|uniref:Major facilitator superfamily (MFS) profile domain-containing protein n=1 Tax=Candidula unifasciata TaxID=100452 RepID=A0A8S3Z535_9EUPU|nr:unnamed protein product [Candidula unifasciata]
MVHQIYIGCGRCRFNLANITVEPVLFLYMFSNFLYFSALQALIFNKVCLHKYTEAFCDDLQHNETYKKAYKVESNYVSSETSFWILKVNLGLTIPSFFVVILFLGAIGDRFGRKPPVIFPCVGAFAAYLSGLLNAKYMTAPLPYILIGPVINGICGGFIACLMAVYSYVSHISAPSTKMVRVGILESMVFLAGTVGVFVSGVIIDRQGYVFTFAALCVTIGVALLYSFFWLDNVHSPITEQRRESCWSMTVKFLRESFQCVTKRREGNTFRILLLQVIAVDVLMLCTSGDMDISLLYLKDSFGFSLTLFGYLRGLDNFLRGLIMITFVPLMKRLTTVTDLPLVMFGLLSYIAAFIILGAANARWMVFLASVVGMFKGIPSAGLRATMSSLVPLEEQGRLFGLIAASESLVSLLASVSFNELYPATRDIFPGLCYMLGAALLLIILCIIMYVHNTLSRGGLSVPYRTIEDVDADDGRVLACPAADETE